MCKLQNEHEASRLRRRNYLKYIGVSVWKMRVLNHQQLFNCPKSFLPMMVFKLQHCSGLLGVWVAVADLNCSDLQELIAKILQALKCPVVSQVELDSESGMADVTATIARHLIMFDGEVDLSVLKGQVYKIPSPRYLSQNPHAKVNAWKVMQQFGS
jgi:hypothetical protein